MSGEWYEFRGLSLEPSEPSSRAMVSKWELQDKCVIAPNVDMALILRPPPSPQQDMKLKQLSPLKKVCSFELVGEVGGQYPFAQSVQVMFAWCAGHPGVLHLLCLPFIAPDGASVEVWRPGGATPTQDKPLCSTQVVDFFLPPMGMPGLWQLLSAIREGAGKPPLKELAAAAAAAAGTVAASPP
eukprot:361484-Chlamydomonas_euryale.AAC.4